MKKAIFLFTIFFLLSGCARNKLQEIHEITFSPTALCVEQDKSIPLQNDSNDEMVIAGIAFSPGSNPEGDFVLKSITINSATTEPRIIPATSGVFNEVRIPPRTSYELTISHVPHKNNAESVGLVDMVFRSPQEGLVQLALSGSSANDTSCGTALKLASLPVALPPQLPIIITRIALVSSLLPLPITTDPEITVTPFDPVPGILLLDSETHTVLLPPIPEEANFILPPTKVEPVNSVIDDFVEVTSLKTARGKYAEDGSITLENIPLHLKEKFEADLTVTLTTGEANPGFLPRSLLRTAGFVVGDNGAIVGSPINPQTLEVTLVGTSIFTNPSGEGLVAEMIGGSFGALLVTAKINFPTHP